MRAWTVWLLVLSVVGLLFGGVEASASGATPSRATTTSGGTPTATPSFWPSGIRVEYLAMSILGITPVAASQGTGPVTITQTNVNLMRITYAPGAALDFHWPGPVTYYVDQGALTVQLGKARQAGIETSSHSSYPRGFVKSGNKPVTVPAGLAIIGPMMATSAPPATTAPRQPWCLSCSLLPSR